MQSIADIHSKYINLFLGDTSLAYTITILCQNNPKQDPLTQVITMMLSAPIEIHLVANGLRMFKSRDIIYPYQHMDEKQREFIISILKKGDWRNYEHSLIWKHHVDHQMDHVKVLTVMCDLIMKSKKIVDERSRLVIANVILQRVHAHVTIKKPVQQLLNKYFFKQEDYIKDSLKTDTNHDSGVESGGGEEWEDQPVRPGVPSVPVGVRPEREVPP